MRKFAVLVKTEKQYDDVVKKLRALGYICNFYKERHNDAFRNHGNKTVLLCDNDGYVLYCRKKYYFEGDDEIANKENLSDYPPCIYYGKKLFNVKDVLKFKEHEQRAKK